MVQKKVCLKHCKVKINTPEGDRWFIQPVSIIKILLNSEKVEVIESQCDSCEEEK